MSINEQDIIKLSNLAKLDLDLNNNDLNFKHRLIDNLNNILHLFDQLENIDFTDIEPLFHSDPNAEQRLRPDVVTEGDIRNIIESIAPEGSIENGLYLVPKVLQND